MLNIFRIFISDFKRIKTNVVAVVIVIGLSILPCLYAWFNILSNWSPYGPDATSNIKVAVASDDKGITIDDTEFNMGETVIEGLEANTTIGWVFTDTTEEAVDGVYSGDYYAALIMPEDFTEDIFRKVAELLYEQKKSGTVNPAQIISLFAEEEEQREVAELFHARIHEVDSAEGRDKALKETILRVKDNSITYRSAHLEPTDMQGFQQIVVDRRTLQNMKKMHISID